MSKELSPTHFSPDYLVSPQLFLETHEGTISLDLSYFVYARWNKRGDTVLYGFTQYDGNPYSTLTRIRELKSELHALQRGLVGDLFSSEEIKGIIANIREASAKRGEEATLNKLSLIRDLRMKLEELTEAVLSKSEWNKQFGTSYEGDNVE